MSCNGRRHAFVAKILALYPTAGLAEAEVEQAFQQHRAQPNLSEAAVLEPLLRGGPAQRVFRFGPTVVNAAEVPSLMAWANGDGGVRRGGAGQATLVRLARAVDSQSRVTANTKTAAFALQSDCAAFDDYLPISPQHRARRLRQLTTLAEAVLGELGQARCPQCQRWLAEEAGCRGCPGQPQPPAPPVEFPPLPALDEMNLPPLPTQHTEPDEADAMLRRRAMAERRQTLSKQWAAGERVFVCVEDGWEVRERLDDVENTADLTTPQRATLERLLRAALPGNPQGLTLEVSDAPEGEDGVVFVRAVTRGPHDARPVQVWALGLDGAVLTPDNPEYQAALALERGQEVK
jgi:hypothetical protein